MSRTVSGCALNRLALALVALAGGMPLLIWFSWLRETPAFWTNAGGYPVWLRELVLLAYYPFLLGSAAGSALYFYRLLACPPPTPGMRSAEFSVFFLMVAAVAIAIAIDLLELG